MIGTNEEKIQHVGRRKTLFYNFRIGTNEEKIQPNKKESGTPFFYLPMGKDQGGVPLLKVFLNIVGTISLVLGIIGIFIPLLPTTPFLLLSAVAYFRGSERLYNLLINHKYLGVYIRNYREHKAIQIGRASCRERV